ncbi:MAG: hypothetical protein H7A42_01970 [Chlamydiales bacterium]|nr:hypothetical protein [Chlamydiales bacterium]
MKTQGLIYIIVLSAIVSVFMEVEVKSRRCDPYRISNSPFFWPAFALFFPAATGIESGMAMSGDLKNPSRSLALGSLASVLTAYLVYARVYASFSLLKFLPTCSARTR